MKKLFSNVWAVIGTVVAALIGLFLFEREKRQEAESKLNLANTEKNEAVAQKDLQRNQEKIVATNALIQQNADELTKDLENAKKASDDDIKKFYKDY